MRTVLLLLLAVYLTLSPGKLQTAGAGLGKERRGNIKGVDEMEDGKRREKTEEAKAALW